MICKAICLSLVSHANQSAKQKIWEVEHNWSKESTLRSFFDCAISHQSSRYISAINIPAQAITRPADIWNMQLKKNLTLFKNLCIVRQFCIANPSEALWLFCALIKRKNITFNKKDVCKHKPNGFFICSFFHDEYTHRNDFQVMLFLKKVIKIPWELF